MLLIRVENRGKDKKMGCGTCARGKSYSYMKSLVEMILQYHSNCDTSIRKSQQKDSNHPETISCTIAKEDPPPTVAIIDRKKSRFHKQ